MIKELNFKDRNLILQMENTASALRIKGLFLSYGIGRKFVRFYADECGEVVVGLKDKTAFLYLSSLDKMEEATEFCKLLTDNVLTDIKLEPMQNHLLEIGMTYTKSNFDKPKIFDVCNEIEAGRVVLSKIFPRDVNSTTYPIWLTDISHRIRHDVSKIYTYKSACTGTSYAVIDGIIYLVQLGTLETHRNQGLATQLLNYIAYDQRAKSIVLLSQDKQSDKYYEKNGFEKIGEWYYYEWK